MAHPLSDYNHLCVPWWCGRIHWDSHLKDHKQKEFLSRKKKNMCVTFIEFRLWWLRQRGWNVDIDVFKNCCRLETGGHGTRVLFRRHAGRWTNQRKIANICSCARNTRTHTRTHTKAERLRVVSQACWAARSWVMKRRSRSRYWL